MNLNKVDLESWIHTTYRDAIKQADLWLDPMTKKYNMLREREVFEVVPRPSNRNVIGSKWVFAIKWNEDGTIERRKARMVAKGYTQVIGENYEETYASVARLESVWLVCAIAAARNLTLWQVDFVSAFLNSDSTYEIYMEQPKGFEEGGMDYVWKLKKTLYGMMQGAHDWAENLRKTFEGHGYYRSKADPQIRSRIYGDEFTLTSTWTDNILGASSTPEEKKWAKDELQLSYEIKDLGEAKLILGIRIDRDQKSGDITLSQQSYAQRILTRFNMDKCTPSSTPLSTGLRISIDNCPISNEEETEMANVPYREALGAIMWLQVATRPDLSYAVNILSRFAHNPGKEHWKMLKHVLSYIKGTLNYGLMYKGGGSLNPIGFVDSDYAGCMDTRKSTEGNVFMVAGGPVS